VATKRRKKHRWFRNLVLFIIAPFVIWFGALILWYNWDGLTKLLTREDAKPAASAAKKSNGEKRASETIFDEDRKKLNEILKQRQ
jgi:hypothetical protein